MKHCPFIFIVLLVALVFSSTASAMAFAKTQVRTGGNNIESGAGLVETASPQAAFKVSRQFTVSSSLICPGLYYYDGRYYDTDLGQFT